MASRRQLRIWQRREKSKFGTIAPPGERKRHVPMTDSSSASRPRAFAASARWRRRGSRKDCPTDETCRKASSMEDRNLLIDWETMRGFPASLVPSMKLTASLPLAFFIAFVATAHAAPNQPASPGLSRYGKAKENMGTFKTADGLHVALFAEEPMIQNPTNIDIDHRGRVW